MIRCFGYRVAIGAGWLVLAAAILWHAAGACAATYYVSSEGSDQHDGLSPETPWRTIARVNTAPLMPGDTVLLRRGDCWREQLLPTSGSEKGVVTYGAYGSGDKPLLLGSVEKNDPGDWESDGRNIWSTTGPLFLGGYLPEGATFYLDSLSFVECDPGEALTCDVGNIIFDGEASCGVKVWNESDLTAQGEYWYDEEKHLLKLYSSRSPASYYSDVECALRRHIIDQSGTGYVVYENLALKYGAAHGIGGGNTHHVTVRDCDLSYIGGGDQRGGSHTVRYGNGVEFWGNAHDNLVERCRLWEIYDAALTNQNSAPNVKQYNITYRNNLIWNCEYSFEYWNRPANSLTHHIRFENNTCIAAGHGWGHTQRPDPSGRHLCFYTSPAQAHDVSIRNNIFFEAKRNAFYAPTWPEAAVAALDIDHNCWFQSEGDMIRLNTASYTMARFAAYQAESGKEPNSFAAKPLLLDLPNGDFHLGQGSPCIDAGTGVGLTRDFDGTPVPQGAAPDVGAYEFQRPQPPPRVR